MRKLVSSVIGRRRPWAETSVVLSARHRDMVEPLLAWCGIESNHDLGTMQEKAPAFGKPTLVTRAVSERLEAIAAGVARLVGNDPECIVMETETLLNDADAYQALARGVSPYAAPQIGDVVERWFGMHSERPFPRALAIGA